MRTATRTWASRYSLDSFLWHNRDSLTPSEISDLRNLKIGDAIHYGGGAAEESSVTRISAAAASAWWGDGTIDFGEIA